MPAILIQLLQLVIPLVLKYGPQAVADVKALLDKENPAAADRDPLRQYAPPYESFGIAPPGK